MVSKRKRTGEQKLLTDVELELMNIIWNLGECTIKEVQSALPADRDLAYTTVATVVKILEQKRFLKGEKKDKAHIYQPAMNRADYEAATLKHISQNLFHGSPTSMVMRLLDESEISEQDLNVFILTDNRIMKARKGLKAQDILVLLKVHLWQKKEWRSFDLAHELGLSPAEVSHALERLKESGLIDQDKKKPVRAAMLEFLVHGLKYVFPVSPGSLSRGMPTAHSAEPLSKVIVHEKDDEYVWPHAEGTLRGQVIEPLYESAPEAAAKDHDLHILLALVDAIRVGRARERKIAVEELTKLVKEN